MSLTRYLTHRATPNIRSWFIHHFPNPGLNKKKELIVPVTSTKSRNKGEIGTAFDYLFRFQLERQNSTLVIKKNWIAEKGFNIIISRANLLQSDKLIIGNIETHSKEVDKERFVKCLYEEYNLAKYNYQKFLNNGEFTTKLLKSSLFLSKLDSKFRSGITDVDIDDISSESIEELEHLISIVPWSNFVAKQHCFLNPDFGEGSKFVEGADADIIIDGVLIDIKSTKELKLHRRDLNQLLGYYLLSYIDYINGSEKNDIQINKIAIYFARYKYFWEIPLSIYYTEKEFDKVVDEFIELIKRPSLDFVKDKAKWTT